MGNPGALRVPPYTARALPESQRSYSDLRQPPGANKQHFPILLATPYKVMHLTFPGGDLFRNRILGISILVEFLKKLHWEIQVL